ncbi:uncharacterized protein IWZ02DRAFT_383704 [Phyllosticta citriasiana]|uniref:Microbial-type PARG catalytic domain-containing protein n=1 Tax=Phyllosticta citriasiana TaxID=595635 RepID=A0ABR1K8F6_9PEZI
MGRTEPTIVKPPQSFRRHVRSKQARATVNKSVPEILRSCPRARRGIDAAELIVDPPPQVASHHAMSNAPPHIRLQAADTLEAATLLVSSPTAKQSRIAVLNMASPLRPGGGLFNGATSQEESLCMRTTLYPSLQEAFYRLPEVGAVYTPDVLVFRHWDEEARDLDKRDRFFVDVISAGMLRFPDLDGGGDDDDDEEDAPKRYAYPRDRELVIGKMRAVLRIARAKGIGKLVLGAWGCGAYGNPVGEIARAWQTVLRGGEGKRIANASESWGPLEVVFAIKDRRMADEFAACFSPRLVVEDSPSCRNTAATARHGITCDDGKSAAVNEMRQKIAEIEAQMTQSRNPGLKARMETILAGLKSQLGELVGPDGDDDDDVDEEGSIDDENDVSDGQQSADEENEHDHYAYSDDAQGDT